MTAPRPVPAKPNANRDETAPRKTHDRIPAASSRGLLKLQSARTSEEFWKATQLLVEEVAPSPSRWLCLRPIRMATALRLLRETRRPRELARFGNGSGAAEDPTPDLEEAVLLKELFARHPAVSHFRSNPLVPMVHLRPLRTGKRDHADFVRRWRWRFGVALAFWNRAQLEGLVLLHREDCDGDYTASELERLRQLHPHLEKALCRVITRRRQEAQKMALASILKPLPLPLILCDWRLRILCESAEGLAARSAWQLGEDAARLLNPLPKRGLPPELADFCRARITAWEEAGPRQRALLEKQEFQLRHPDRPQLRASLRMLRQAGFAMTKPLFLLRLETLHTDDEQRQICPVNFAVFTQLSAAERELALLVCDGYGNEAIARRLGKSVYTIKAQLHSIFEKLHVKSRSQLIPLLIRNVILLLSVSSTDLTGALLSGF